MDYSNQRIPEHERMLATGAAVANMLNAAHMLGYGAYWSTGLGTYNDEISAALGFDSLDYRFMGYLAVGTPIDPPRGVERPDWSEFVTEWSGPSA
jgi:nitroreductase